MEPRLLRYSAQMVMASFVVRGLLFTQRIAPDQVMHTLRGGHEVHDSGRKSGIHPHACFTSFLVVVKAAGNCHSMENSSVARRFAMPAKDHMHNSGSMMQADCMWTPQPLAIVRQNGQENSSLSPSWQWEIVRIQYAAASPALVYLPSVSPLRQTTLHFESPGYSLGGSWELGVHRELLYRASSVRTMSAAKIPS